MSSSSRDRSRVSADSGASANSAATEARPAPARSAAPPTAASPAAAANRLSGRRPPDPAKLSLNTATTRVKWGLAEAIEGCARHGVLGIAPWRDQLQAMGVAEAARAIRAHGLTVTGVCRGGMFPADSPDKRAAALDDNRRAIEEAHALDARCLVVVAGGLPDGSRDLAGARAQVRDGLAALLPDARAAGVRLALEPLHPMYAADRACVNTLAQALDLCDALDPQRNSVLGVAVDVYHVWWDPLLAPSIARAGRDRIFGYHICDWLVPTTDLLLDRGMMGDGVIDLPSIRSLVEGTGYDGFHEVEIFSRDNWWQRDPDEVLAICKERHQACC